MPSRTSSTKARAAASGKQTARTSSGKGADGKSGRPPKTLEQVVAPRVRRLIQEVTEAGGNGVWDLVIESVERQLLVEALAATGGNQVQAARILGINRNTLRRKADALGVSV